MLPFSDMPESDIRTFVRHWMKLLAQGRLEEACSLLDEPNSYGDSWTPQRITRVVPHELPYHAPVGPGHFRRGDAFS